MELRLCSHILMTADDHAMLQTNTRGLQQPLVACMPAHQHGEEEGDDEVLLQQVLQGSTRWSDVSCGYITRAADPSSQDIDCGS